MTGPGSLSATPWSSQSRVSGRVSEGGGEGGREGERERGDEGLGQAPPLSTLVAAGQVAEVEDNQGGAPRSSVRSVAAWQPST